MNVIDIQEFINKKDEGLSNDKIFLNYIYDIIQCKNNWRFSKNKVFLSCRLNQIKNNYTIDDLVKFIKSITPNEVIQDDVLLYRQIKCDYFNEYKDFSIYYVSFHIIVECIIIQEFYNKLPMLSKTNQQRVRRYGLCTFKYAKNNTWEKSFDYISPNIMELLREWLPKSITINDELYLLKLNIQEKNDHDNDNDNDTTIIGKKRNKTKSSYIATYTYE